MQLFAKFKKKSLEWAQSYPKFLYRVTTSPQRFYAVSGTRKKKKKKKNQVSMLLNCFNEQWTLSYILA